MWGAHSFHLWTVNNYGNFSGSTARIGAVVEWDHLGGVSGQSCPYVRLGPTRGWAELCPTLRLLVTTRFPCHNTVGPDRASDSELPYKAILLCHHATCFLPMPRSIYKTTADGRACSAKGHEGMGISLTYTCSTCRIH